MLNVSSKPGSISTEYRLRTYVLHVMFNILTSHVTSVLELWKLTKSSDSKLTLAAMAPANTRASRTKMTSVAFILLGYRQEHRGVKETKSNSTLA